MDSIWSSKSRPSKARAVVAALAVLAASHHVSEAQSSRLTEGVAAIVNDLVISFSDVRSRAGLVLMGLGAEITDESVERVLPRVMQSLIDEKLKSLEAARFEIQISEKEIDAQFASLAERNNASIEDMVIDLRRRGINPQTLRDRIRGNISWRRMITGYYGSRVRVSEAQIDDARARWSRISRQEQFRVAEIFLPAATETEKARALRGAWRIYEQIVAGARFDVAARQYSESITAATGGELGWLSRPDLPPDLADTILALPTNGLSEPIVVDAGVYLVALIDRRISAPREDIPLRLKQAVGWSEDTRPAMEALVASEAGCDQLETATVSIVDLGELAPSSLDAAFKQAVMDTGVGAWTPILPYGENGLSMIMVCDTGASVPGVPDREAIKNQIFDQQLNLLASRHLRNLRRGATIIRREGGLR